MGRLLLIVVVALVLVWLLRRSLGARRGGGADAPPQGELVSCAHCHVLLPKGEARSAGGRHFCSEEHWRLGPRDD